VFAVVTSDQKVQTGTSLEWR